MSSVFIPNGGHPSTVMGKGTSPDDASTDTALAGRGSESMQLKFVEKLIHFRFETSSEFQEQQKVIIVHTHWMKTVLESFGNDVKVMNKKNTRVLNVDLIHWSDPLVHGQQFNVYRKRVGSSENRRECTLLSIKLSFVYHSIS